MEERAEKSVSFRGMHVQSLKLTPMSTLAGFSIVALVIVGIWQLAGFGGGAGPTESVRAVGRTGSVEPHLNWQRVLAETTTPEELVSDSSDPEGLSNIGGNVMGTLVGSYVAMKDAGTYLPSSGARVAESVAAELRADISYTLYSTDDISIVEDNSLERALAYRSDLRTALEPLLENSVYELEVFGSYLDSGDMQHLVELERMAKNYSLAAENAALVAVPRSAVSHHLNVLNALVEFEATLSALAAYADDPFASAALIRTLNDAEANVFLSFNALATFFRLLAAPDLTASNAQAGAAQAGTHSS